MGYNDFNPMDDRTDNECYDSVFCADVIAPAHIFVLRFPGLREKQDK